MSKIRRKILNGGHCQLDVMYGQNCPRNCRDDEAWKSAPFASVHGLTDLLEFCLLFFVKFAY
jgi:hypothetical protein